ncbi:hypothetical protein F3Y22_tig00110257pilonHSYRG00013 [Hibiscus syriacus]|uniref:RNase H type-1 domain-containing protein n=1 Tax=Hibiscus syriacus TaxID=106335 RepID=A0A6A3BC37_HIBSY|nr:hypothetical protein F3Y22_tig00110257pilonHSYRG00013 [Hibiscus syriacus]
MVAQQFRNFIGTFIEYDSSVVSLGYSGGLRIRVGVDTRKLLKRKKKLPLSSGQFTYANFNMKNCFGRSMAEAIVALHAVIFAGEMGFRSIIIEGDSRTMIEKLENRSPDLFEIRNMVAHCIATVSGTNSEDSFWVDEAPGCAELKALEDRRWMASV